MLFVYCPPVVLQVRVGGAGHQRAEWPGPVPVSTWCVPVTACQGTGLPAGEGQYMLCTVT
jgi:hypothetical protein